jgi:DNA-directed RNA polymerase I subunit RPA2
MPFSESGITPDIIINPNAFPSRMTIGMLIESMAGKAGSLEGVINETEPFRPVQDDDPVKHFGEQLTKHGYNYYGNELMYSGIYGTPMKAEIFIGCVYYQRLRHMVSDKSQARSTGPVDVLT